MSVVPPPMSTIMLPAASVIGRPAPIAAAMRFFDQVHFAGLGAIRAVLHRAALDLRDLRRHTDDDARADEALAAMRLLDEVAEHLLGGLEVGDHAVPHRADGGDAAGRPPEHLFGIAADSFDLVVHVVDRHDRRFVENDAGAAREHAGVGGTQVNRQVVGEERHRSEQHRDSFSSGCAVMAGWKP